MLAMNEQSRTTQITSRIKACLEPLGSDEHLNEPLYAINWFNTRWSFLYTFYTMLAAWPVARSQSRLWLKAKHRSILSGSPQDQRSMLLIVRYPAARHFLDLLSNKFFQVISLLRELAVKQFSFVLNHRVPSSRFSHDLPPLPEGTAIAVHHFSSQKPFLDDLNMIGALIDGSQVSICMASHKSVQVVLERAGEVRTALPFSTDKVVIFSGPDFEELEFWLAGPSYTAFIASLSSSYVATLERTG